LNKIKEAEEMLKEALQLAKDDEMDVKAEIFAYLAGYYYKLGEDDLYDKNCSLLMNVLISSDQEVISVHAYKLLGWLIERKRHQEALQVRRELLSCIDNLLTKD
jgi:hypothetical protein